MMTLPLFAIDKNPKYTVKFIADMRKSIERVKSKHPEYRIIPTNLPIAQSIIETGWGKSDLARNKHNYFGLRRGEKYATFSNIDESIDYYFHNILIHHEYINLIKAAKRGENVSQLANYLDKYAENPKYVKLIKQTIKLYKLT